MITRDAAASLAARSLANLYQKECMCLKFDQGLRNERRCRRKSQLNASKCSWKLFIVVVPLALLDFLREIMNPDIEHIAAGTLLTWWQRFWWDFEFLTDIFGEY